MMIPDEATGVGAPLGGINDLATSIVSVPTFLALCAFFFAALQGFVALESVDPCRISTRKMNILLSLELIEVIIAVSSELLSFVELRAALKEKLTWLHWVAPCLLAAGVLETIADVYFTLAVLTKSRVGWIPVSVVGVASSKWEILPFFVTAVLSLILVGWRMRWWWTGDAVTAMVADAASASEVALKPGVVGFAVGWTVAITGLVFIIFLLTDCSEDRANYIAGLKYLWNPDKWIDEQHGDIKIWYRETENSLLMQEYISSAVLDASVDIPETRIQLEKLLERKPLHCGNAIVGHDKAVIDQEDRSAARLHNVVLLAEHVVVLPLLIVVIVIVARLHESMDVDTFNAVRQLADSAIILAFLELAIGIKNVVWSTRGTGPRERAQTSDAERLATLRSLQNDASFCGEIPQKTLQPGNEPNTVL